MIVRVLVAPDSFGDTLTSHEAALAIAEGWHRHAPGDHVDVAPLSDGGPGLIDVVHASLGGDRIPVVVTGPTGTAVPAEVLMVDGTAWIESAQACGLHLVPFDPATSRRDPGTTTTRGVGECIAHAVSCGARRVVVGIGGTGTNDGGAGAWAALGAMPGDVLGAGGLALAHLESLDLATARTAVAGIELVIATDVDVPLLGLRGATNGFGPQKGATQEQVMRLEGVLEHLVHLAGRRADGRDPAVALGAGAGGGLGYGLMHLGATRVAGMAAVIEAIGLDDRIAAADLVVTGEGAFDWSSLRGKVVAGVATRAQSHGIPTVVMAGQVRVGRREFGAIGVESAFAMADLAGSPEAAIAEPARHLADLAERVARTWSRR